MSRVSRKALFGAALAAILPAALAQAGTIFFLPNGAGGWNAYELEGGVPIFPRPLILQPAARFPRENR